jgi:4-hydroxy-tetrahydrodipicolinate synthase
MLTPFSADGGVNLAEARRVARHLVDEQKNDGVVVSGTTGESPTTSKDEKLALLDATLAEVGDRAAVLFGAGTYDTAESARMAREAERAGAHGVMVVNPYYNRPGQEGLEAHFRAVADATALPVMLYNIQPRTAINLETPTLIRIIEACPNVAAVKEASGNMAQIAEVCASVPEGFRVYSGDDALTLPVLSVGGHGLVSVAAHLVGARLKEMIAVFPADPARAARLARELHPVIKAVFSAPSPVPVKYGLSLRGFDCEAVRLPLVPLSAEHKARLAPVFAPSAVVSA